MSWVLLHLLECHFTLLLFLFCRSKFICLLNLHDQHHGDAQGDTSMYITGVDECYDEHGSWG